MHLSFQIIIIHSMAGMVNKAFDFPKYLTETIMIIPILNTDNTYVNTHTSYVSVINMMYVLSGHILFIPGEMISHFRCHSRIQGVKKLFLLYISYLIFHLKINDFGIFFCSGNSLYPAWVSTNVSHFYNRS